MDAGQSQEVKLLGYRDYNFEVDKSSRKLYNILKYFCAIIFILGFPDKIR